MATRTKHRILLGAALVCGAAILSERSVATETAGTPAVRPAEVARTDVAAGFPVASDVRVAGDSKRTRFILDLDKSVPLRAFALADPYRVVVDLPQVAFHLPSSANGAGRGLIKAFRYGLVMPGGSRMVFDLSGPAKVDKAYVLDAANGQPARLIIDLEAVDRTAFVQ